MATNYPKITASKKISNDFETINETFEMVGQDVDRLDNRDAQLQASINQTGQAIDSVQAQIDTLVINGDSSAAAAQAAVDANGHDYKNLKLRLDTEHTELAAQLAETEQKINVVNQRKADEEYVNSELELKRDKAVKITGGDLDISADANKIKLIHLSDEVQLALAGDAPVNPIIPNGSISREKPADGSYTRNMTKFYEPATVNLYDKTYNTPGYYNISDGTYLPSADHVTTDYIPVSEGEQFTQAQATNINVTFYDISKNFVSGVFAKTWTIPLGQGIAYMRSTVRSAEIETTMIVKGSVLPETYIDYKVIDPKLLITQENFADELVLTNENLPNDISPSKLNGISRNSPNLFDKAKVTPGYYNYTNGAYNSNPLYSTSDFIPCSEGKTYVHQTSSFVTFYNENKDFVSGLQNANPFTVPIGLGIVYMRVTIDLNGVMYRDTDMVVEGSVFPSTYYPYERYVIDGNVIVVEHSSSKQSKWTGKKWNVLGDSITFGYMTNKVYHKFISDTKGITVNNYGISGSRIAEQSGRSDHMSGRYADMVDADLTTVLGGVNDFINGVPLGMMADRTIDTFYGACHVLFSGLIEKYPLKSIGVITPIQSNRTRSADSLQLTDFINAYTEVAHYYSLPVLDMYNEGGLTAKIPSAIDMFMPDGLHPNEGGHEIMSKRITAFIESF